MASEEHNINSGLHRLISSQHTSLTRKSTLSASELRIARDYLQGLDSPSKPAAPRSENLDTDAIDQTDQKVQELFHQKLDFSPDEKA